MKNTKREELHGNERRKNIQKVHERCYNQQRTNVKCIREMSSEINENNKLEENYD